MYYSIQVIIDTAHDGCVLPTRMLITTDSNKLRPKSNPTLVISQQYSLVRATMPFQTRQVVALCSAASLHSYQYQRNARRRPVIICSRKQERTLSSSDSSDGRLWVDLTRTPSRWYRSASQPLTEQREVVRARLELMHKVVKDLTKSCEHKILILLVDIARCFLKTATTLNNKR